jgi:hypothetical protein
VAGEQLDDKIRLDDCQVNLPSSRLSSPAPDGSVPHYA